MKSKFLASLIIVFLFITLQCKKTNNDCNIDTSSITEVDYSGNALSSPDKSDWTEDKNMTAQELNVFTVPDPAMLSNTETGNVSGILGFPNPTIQDFRFYYNCSTVASGQIVITDCKLNVIETHFYTTSIGGNILAVKLDTTKYINNTNYRVYYSFYSKADGQFFKGHGDIRIKR